MGGPQPADRADGGRGQTTLDFVVALGVFLLVIGFVAGFLPELYASFDDEPERALVADRAAVGVVAGLVTDPDTPSVLNESCAHAFLRQNASACGFDTGASLTEQVGIGSRSRVNVSLRRNVTGDPGLEILCTDGSRIQGCGAGGVALATGPRVPAGRTSVGSERRIVYVDGQAATLVVSIW